MNSIKLTGMLYVSSADTVYLLALTLDQTLHTDILDGYWDIVLLCNSQRD